MKPAGHVLLKTDYRVERAVTSHQVRDLVHKYHYAKSCPNTFTDLFELRQGTDTLGGAWFVPTFPGPAQSVAGDRWREVTCLSRLVLCPSVPTNGASFLMGRALRALKGKYLAVVTYADEGEGHLGSIYRATNWEYHGARRTAGHWIDPISGKRVSKKATINRSNETMRELGLVQISPSIKHKFVYWLQKRAMS